MSWGMQVLGWFAGLSFVALGLIAAIDVVNGWWALRQLSGGGTSVFHDVHVSWNLGPLQLEGTPAILAMIAIPLIPIGLGLIIIALAWRVRQRSRGHQS